MTSKQDVKLIVKLSVLQICSSKSLLSSSFRTTTGCIKLERLFYLRWQHFVEESEMLAGFLLSVVVGGGHGGGVVSSVGQMLGGDGLALGGGDLVVDVLAGDLGDGVAVLHLHGPM